MDPEDQIKQIKELLKNDENTKRRLIEIVLEDNKKAGKVVRVSSPPYSKIARILDCFKNHNIFPECPNFDAKMYPMFTVAVFRMVYQPYQELLLLKNSVDYGDLI